MQGTIAIGSSLDGYISDIQKIINELAEIIGYLDMLVQSADDGGMCIGTGGDQIKLFAEHLYMQVYKMQSFYEVGLKYLECSRKEYVELDKATNNIISDLGTKIASKTGR